MAFSRKGHYTSFKSPLFDKEWRKVPWEDKKEDLEYVKNFKPHPGAKHVRVLLHGPPGSGKSSFINSIDSALRGRIGIRASADTGFDYSFTQEYRSFKVMTDNPGTFYPYVFCDTMGVESGSGRGIDVNNMKLIMEGHVNEGCKLNPGSNPTGTDYIPNPTINDKVHVLVCVVDASKAGLMDDETVHKMKEVREAARVLRIPQIAVLTKIDEACPKVKKNIRNVYKSKMLKKQMEELSANIGIPMNSIFLVKNYSTESETAEDTDTLILNIMRKILHFGEDYLNDIIPTMDTQNTQRPVPAPRKCD
ncbi:unnamed protein product [Ophioblennius macclurei]